jgi:hypothetical protein
MANSVCNKCGVEQLLTEYEPPLADFSPKTERATHGKISVEFRWDNSNVSTMVRTSKATIPSLTRIWELYQVLNTFPKELVTLIEQYAKYAIADFSLRPSCLCPNSIQFSRFNPFHQALKKAFPNDISVDQLHTVPAMSVFVPRPSNDVPFAPSIGIFRASDSNSRDLTLHFPNATASIAFRFFFKEAFPPGTNHPHDVYEVNSKCLRMAKWGDEKPGYPTALIVAVKDKKLCGALTVHLIDPVTDSKHYAQPESCTAYREGILDYLPMWVQKK